MFQFPGFASQTYVFSLGYHVKWWVSPFGYLRIKARLAAPRSVSSLATSFIASSRLGIHRTPLNSLCLYLGILHGFAISSCPNEIVFVQFRSLTNLFNSPNASPCFTTSLYIKSVAEIIRQPLTNNQIFKEPFADLFQGNAESFKCEFKTFCVGSKSLTNH
jgi:hypothetical protein